MDIEIISTAELGDRSYVVSEDGVAVVVDPQRDIDRVERVLADRQLRCELVVETHIHNDYVTGGYELARRSGARYVVHAADPVRFDRTPAADGDVLLAGPLTVEVIATPGHTDTHLSYLVHGADSDQAPAVFTGGSLLYGSVGRTDLIDPARTEELTRKQYHSAHRLAALHEHTGVFPTHGFGSFCSSGAATGADSSTIGREKTVNDALTSTDEDEFVSTLIRNLTAYPAYYAHMAGHNLAGPAPFRLDPPATVDPVQLRRRLDAGEWVVDLRDRSAYAGGHLVGTISIALGAQFSTYLGWLIPYGAGLTLLAEHPDQIADAQRQLVRIGLDDLDGAATGPVESLTAGEPLAHYPETTFADPRLHAGSDLLDPARPGRLVLDVRRDDERAISHIPGSAHLPLHQLLDHLDDVPPATQLWLHCGSGFRASIAASILARAGHDVVYINDDYSAAVDRGLTSRDRG